MPANAPKLDDMFPIDSDDHTVEVDTRWMLDMPELKAKAESLEEEYECSTDYDDPRIGSTLTATQVIDLLNLGK